MRLSKDIDIPANNHGTTQLMISIADGERGLFGAVGEDLTVDLIGKQTFHGPLGTVGSATVGSLTEV